MGQEPLVTALCPGLSLQAFLPLALHRLTCGRGQDSSTDGVPQPQRWRLDAGIQPGYMMTSPTGLGLRLRLASAGVS